MPAPRRPTPPVPNCPRARVFAKDIKRSYPTGRREVSRAIRGQEMTLVITTRDRFPTDTRANLVTTLNTRGDGEWTKLPYTLVDEKTLVCRVTPQREGLFAFWAQFSDDGGATWMHDPVPDAWVLVDPPQVDGLRMYTLIPAVSGNITDWTHDLKRIADLGFSAVHFLPLTTLDSSLSPYSARSLFNVDPMYLDPHDSREGLAQLESLVDAAESLGIALCFDLVLNHVGVDSEIARNAPEWIMPDEASPDGLRRARFFSDQGWQKWNDLVLINYEHPSQRIRTDIWDYMTEYALFWAQFASRTNGFVRFDNLHSSDKNFINALTRRLHGAYPNIGIVAEYFTDADTLLDTVPHWGLSLVLATPWDSRFVRQLRDYLKYLHSIGDHVRFFMPISSHDSGTPTQEFASPAATIPRYVAAALMGTGATGITQGVEWGQPKKIEFIGKQPRLKPVEPAPFADLIRRVNELLVHEPAFRRGDNVTFVDDAHEAVIAVFRREASGPSGRLGFLVVCNFDILGPQTFRTDLSAALGVSGAIECVDRMDGSTHAFNAKEFRVTMAACAVHVFEVRVAAR